MTSLVQRVRLGELLIAAGRLKPEHLERALAVQAASHLRSRLGDILVELAFCDEEDIARSLSEQLDMPYLDARTVVCDREALDTLGRDLCADQQLVPTRSEDGRLLLAMADPLGIELIDFARQVLGASVGPAAATRSAIRAALEALHKPVDSLDLMIQEASTNLARGGLAVDLEELEDGASSAPAVRLVNEIVARAAEEGASDVHVEPGATGTDVRYRIDGALRQVLHLPTALHETVTARLKIMADMDIMERRAPQDGHILTTVGARQVDMRVSTLPTTHGEKTVLRLLGTGTQLPTLEAVGFDADQLEHLRWAIRQPQGCVIVTGPTGSGKSSTLLVCLQEIANESLNVTTIEDPVEREIPGVSHTQVNEVAGLTFANGLRALLRQDPDVIMVGEIRDAETAEISMRAALTGHLLLTTVHATHALAAITRLRDIGIPDFLLSSAITLVMAQRLMRTLCPACKAPQAPSELERAVILDALGRPLEGELWTAEGCEHCGGRGYLGRTAAAEVVPFREELQRLVAAGADELTLARAARAEGARWMFETGLSKVLSGATSMRELMRTTPLPRRDEEAAGGTRIQVGAEHGATRFAEAKPSSDPKRFEEFVRGISSAPSLPDVVARLSAVMGDETSGASEIAEVIETDPAIAAKVVGVANSAALGLRRKVTSVTEAVAYLGLSQIWALTVGASVAQALEPYDTELLSLEDLWVHSYGTAVCARVLSHRVMGGWESEAYLAGLLHDVGKLVLAAYLPEEFASCIRSAELSGAPLWQVEQTYLSFCHADVGAWLLEGWRIPEPVCRAVRAHHYPPSGEQPDDAHLTTVLVSLANDTVKRLGVGFSGDTTIYESPADDQALLGLSDEDLQAAGRATTRAVDEALRMLGHA